MGMPVAQWHKTVCPHVLDCRKLLLGIKRKMLIGMVDIRQKINLFDELISILYLACNQSACLIGQFLFRMAYYFVIVRF